MRILKILSFILMVFIFSSCQKCQDCTYEGTFPGNGTMKVCSGDFESNQDYLDEIENLEANNWDCY